MVHSIDEDAAQLPVACYRWNPSTWPILDRLSADLCVGTTCPSCVVLEQHLVEDLHRNVMMLLQEEGSNADIIERHMFLRCTWNFGPNRTLKNAPRLTHGDIAECASLVRKEEDFIGTFTGPQNTVA